MEKVTKDITESRTWADSLSMPRTDQMDITPVEWDLATWYVANGILPDEDLVYLRDALRTVVRPKDKDVWANLFLVWQMKLNYAAWKGGVGDHGHPVNSWKDMVDHEVSACKRACLIYGELQQNSTAAERQAKYRAKFAQNEVNILKDAWKEAVAQRNEAMKSWEAFVKLKREEYRSAERLRR